MKIPPLAVLGLLAALLLPCAQARDLPGGLAMQRALEALDCAQRAGLPPARHLAVIDYGLPSAQPRLWVLDLRTGALRFEEHVAHGRGSGEARAVRFSNRAHSHHTSLGLFRARESYVGRNGYSLRLQGLEPGINDQALARGIVIHGADYVSEAFVKATGRLGRSHGCPAVRNAIARSLIDTLKDDAYLFAYHPDAAWTATSVYRSCPRESPLRAVSRQHEAGLRP